VLCCLVVVAGHEWNHSPMLPSRGQGAHSGQLYWQRTA
jgi:hypothetical protein